MQLSWPRTFHFDCCPSRVNLKLYYFACRKSFVETVSSGVGIPSWRLTYVRDTEAGKEAGDDDSSKCMTVTFGIVGNGKCSFSG